MVLVNGNTVGAVGVAQKRVQPAVSGADYAVVNLETTLAGGPPYSRYSIAQILRRIVLSSYFLIAS